METPSFSPQNTNESIDLGALCHGLLGAADGPQPAHRAPPTATNGLCEETEADAHSCCWGGLLKDDHSECEAGFVNGKAHFKNKFCPRCRHSLAVPASRVRALTPEIQSYYQNHLRAGFWKGASPSIGGGEVRIANNTITCDGPWLVVYRKGCTVPTLPWAPMPKEWISGDLVRFSVAKGTLVPVAEMGNRPGKRSPPSYAVPPNVPPKRQRRAHTSPGAAAAVAGVAPGVLPVGVLPVGVLPIGPARARSSSEESLTSIATASTSRRGSTTASPALAASAPGGAPPPAAPLVAAPLQPPSLASLKPAALVVNSPTLSKQSSAGSSPPGDTAQLAVRLVAAHEHIASLLEGALRPLSPIRPTLSPTQAASLYEQLNKTRAMIEECVGLARTPQPPPQPPSPPPSAGIAPTRIGSDLSEVEEDAFASLVAVASAK